MLQAVAEKRLQQNGTQFVALLFFSEG